MLFVLHQLLLNKRNQCCFIKKKKKETNVERLVEEDRVLNGLGSFMNL